MRNIALTCLLVVLSMPALALESDGAQRMVQRYAELVACKTSSPGDYRRNEYKAVEIPLSMSEIPGADSLWVVYWEGNIGCESGPAAGPRFTAVIDSSYAGRAIVKPMYTADTPGLVIVHDIASEDGFLVIDGLTYGSDDGREPQTPIQFKFKPGYDNFERVD